MSQKLNRFYKYLERYEKLVMSNAGKFVDYGLAEDVSQETFVKMYEHLDYLDDGSIQGWLMVVSRNIARDYMKKGGSIENISLDMEELTNGLKGYSESAEESYEKSEKQKAVREFLRTACNLLYEKNPSWYYIMLDSCMLGMSSAEIAEVMNTTPGNVDVMKSRARAFLKNHFKSSYREFF